jgi:hypothetical protein
MRKLVGLCIAVAFAALLCPAAICEEGTPPARPGTGERPALTEEQRTQLKEAMQTLQELREKLRDAEQKARQDPEVVKAFEAIRKAQEAANKALDEAIIKANPDLKDAVNQKRALMNKLQKLGGGRFMPGGARGGTRGGRGRSGGAGGQGAS